MQKPSPKIVIGVAGSSGSIYAKVLLDRLVQLRGQYEEAGLVMSANAEYNWELELGNRDFLNYPFRRYEKRDFMAPFASGSARYGCMIVCPCSMGLLGRIAAGISDDLMTRAADVILKERRRLILVPREAPLSTIHLENMLRISRAGGIICPAVPSFYSQPADMETLAATVVDRVLDLAGFDLPETYRWGEQES